MIAVLASILFGLALAAALWAIWGSIERASHWLPRALAELAAQPEPEPIAGDWPLAVALALLILILAA